MVPHATLSSRGDGRPSLARSGPTLVLDPVPPTASRFSNQNLMEMKGFFKGKSGALSGVLSSRQERSSKAHYPTPVLRIMVLWHLSRPRAKTATLKLNIDSGGRSPLGGPLNPQTHRGTNDGTEVETHTVRGSHPRQEHKYVSRFRSL